MPNTSDGGRMRADVGRRGFRVSPRGDRSVTGPVGEGLRLGRATAAVRSRRTFATWSILAGLAFIAFALSVPARAVTTDVPPAQTLILKSETLPNDAAAANPLSQIWRDALPSLRARLGDRAPTFFTARFIGTDTTIIVSVSADDPNCENLSGALARPTAGRACPMRVAVIAHGNIWVPVKNDHFVFADPVDANGARLPPSPTNETTITLLAGAHDLAFSQRIDGQRADAVNPTPIHLEY